jgi:mono/diheme cytochrome c family protein
MIMRTHAMLLRAICAIGLGSLPFVQIARAPAAPSSTEEGKHVYRMNCAGCHQWFGAGGGGYGGAAANLRKTQLDREQMILTISCGRPGAGMPYHLRDAYTPEHKCYGLTKAEMGNNMPPAPNNFLRPSEIEAVADYVIADIKGRGDQPTFAECQAYYGTHSRVCDVYEHASTTNTPGNSGK